MEIRNEVLRVVNGSRLYGTNTDSSDNDAISVYIEDPNTIFSLDKGKVLSLSERHPEEKSKTKEVDGVSYPLRHYFSLLANANPSLLATLFAENHVLFSTEIGEEIFKNREIFLSIKAKDTFLGYMKSQFQRLKGEKVGHIPSRPELVDKYGFDVKYAMQIARLALQGIEFLQYGRISNPMPQTNIDLCMNIRNGMYTYKICLLILEYLENRLKEEAEKSLLPKEPNYDKIWELSENLHLRQWKLI